MAAHKCMCTELLSMASVCAFKKKFIVHRVTLSGINRKHTKKRNKTTLEPPYYLQNPYNCKKYIMQNGFSVGLYTYLYVSVTGTLLS